MRHAACLSKLGSRYVYQILNWRHFIDWLLLLCSRQKFQLFHAMIFLFIFLFLSTSKLGNRFFVFLSKIFLLYAFHPYDP